MKNIVLLISLTCLIANAAFCQLKLTSSDGRKIKLIPNGTTIGIKLPTVTSKDTCDCNFTVIGKLNSFQNETANVVLRETTRSYYEADGVAKKVTERYRYEKLPVTTPIDISKAMEISIYKPTRKVINRVGYVLLITSILEGLVIGPIAFKNDRKAHDAIVGGALVTGIVFSAIPDNKKYYLQQPVGEPRDLWKIK
jgi:hypothetical protein